MATAERLAECLGADIVQPGQDERARELFRQRFQTRKRWVLLMSVGIAVRFIDGLAADKKTDPAVVVLDEGCHHAVSLLSGHEGGANDLAFAVANAVGATPVITTATESLKPLVVGIGCRKGVSAEAIEDAVCNALGERQLSEVRCLASIDLKAEEPGLLEFSRKHNLPLRIFMRESVAARAWVTAPSAWVRSVTGADGVSEPCALMASPRGQLLVPKSSKNGVVVAIVEDMVAS